MKITIVKNAYVKASTQDSKLREFLKINEGKSFEVETRWLFDNQYNVDGFRIYDSMIESIEDDARVDLVGVKYCRYCGNVLHKDETQCNNNEKCKEYKPYERYSKEKTFFLVHPNNIETIDFRELSDCRLKKDNNSDYQVKYDNGRYDYISSYPELGYYRINYRNSCINFKYDFKTGYYWISNGIGYKRVKNLSSEIVSFVRVNKIDKVMKLIGDILKE